MAAKNSLTSSAQEIEEYFERMKQAKAPAWIPAPATTMAGEVIGLRMGESGWGPYPIVIYKLDDGSCVSVHAFHTLLRDQLKALDTTLGKRQILTYLGKKERTAEEKEAGKNEYHDYYVENVGEGTIQGKDENFTF